ncbi:MAG: helix-turn-helix domain-containing protein [Tepidisphaeraceae bacterium]
MQHGTAGRRNISSGESDVSRYLRSRNELSQSQLNAVELLLRGMSDQQVAGQLGVDRGTILRWRKKVAFQREMDRQRRILWERSAGEIQAMVSPALDILRKQLSSDDTKLAMRAAGVVLRFATPSRLAPGARKIVDEEKQLGDDLIAYVDAPLPGQPGAPEETFDEEEGDSAPLGHE